MSKELEETIKSLKWKCDKRFFNSEEKEELELLFYYIENSIPKEKVEEKIRQLDEEIVNTDELDSYTLEPLIEKKEVLQEILEGK